MAYSYFRSETVQSSQVTGTLTDFPALLSRTHNDFRTVGNGGHVQNSNGYDLNLFTNSAGAPGALLDIETESYNAATGAVIKWARVPSIATSTVIWWQYGDSGISTSQDNQTGVWDSNFQYVGHLVDGSSLSAADSTTSPLSPTINGATAANGQIDGCASFVAGSSQDISLGNPTKLQITGVLTIEAWINYTGGASTRQIVAKDKDTGGRAYTFDVGSTNIRFYINGGAGADIVVGATTLSASTWYYVAGIYTPSTPLHVRLNGATDATTPGNAAASISSATANVHIGVREYLGFPDYFDGQIDEVRISNAARSDNWLLASYNVQNAPTSFWSLGAEQAAGGGAAPSKPDGMKFVGHRPRLRRRAA